MAITPVAYALLNHSVTAGATLNCATQLNKVSDNTTYTLAQDDLVVVALGYSGTAARTQAQLRASDPSAVDYTDIPSAVISQTDTNFVSLNASYKFMGATPDATISIPGVASSANSMFVIVLVFSGVDQTTPLGGVTPVTAVGFNGARPDCGSITTPASPSGSVIVGIGAQASGLGTALTVPTTTPYDATARYTGITNRTTATNNGSMGYGIKTGVGTSTAFDASVWNGGQSTNTGSNGSLTFVLAPAVTTQTLTPSLFTNSQTFPAETVSASKTLIPSAYTNSQSFYAPTVLATYTLTPSLFTNTQTYYTHNIGDPVQTLTPSLFTNTNTFYNAAVSATYSLTPSLVLSLPNLIVNGTFDTDTSGWAAGSNSTISNVSGKLRVTTTTLGSISSANQSISVTAGKYYNLTIDAASGTAQGASYGIGNAPNAASITGSALTPVNKLFAAPVATTYILLRTGSTSGSGTYYDWDNVSVVDASIQPPVTTSSYTLTASLFTNTPTFYSASVQLNQGLTPSLFTNSQSFYAPTVTPGSVTLTPNLFTNSNSFFAETVTSSYSLTPALFTNSNTFFAETVTPGTVTLTPNLFTNTNTFYAETVTGGGTIAPDLFTNTVTFYGVTVTPGAINLTPSLVTNTSTLYAPSAVNDNTLVPPLLSSGNVIYLPTAVAGLVTLSPSLFENVSIFSTFDIVSPPKWRTSTNIEFIVGRRLPPKRRHLTFNNRR